MALNRDNLSGLYSAGARRFVARIAGHRLMVSAVLLLCSVSAIAQTGEEINPSGGISATVYSQYLWHGRDYTFADAPVVVVTARGRYLLPAPVGWIDDPKVNARLTNISPILRRGDPHQTALADTIRATGSTSAVFFGTRSDPGWMGIQVGLDVSLFYGAAIAQGAGYGTLRFEPFVSVALPRVYGAPRWSAVVDLTPDQVGWRGGLEWFPSFDVPWGTVNGYVGAFRPHNYLKQKSDSFFGRLLGGELGLALVALIPSDLTVGAASLIPLTSTIHLQPELELLIVPNRAQNPHQVVPAASLTIFYGPPSVAPQVHEGR